VAECQKDQNVKPSSDTTKKKIIPRILVRFVFYLDRPLFDKSVFFFVCSTETKVMHCYGTCRMVSSQAEVKVGVRMTGCHNVEMCRRALHPCLFNCILILSVSE